MYIKVSPASEASVPALVGQRSKKILDISPKLYILSI